MTARKKTAVRKKTVKKKVSRKKTAAKKAPARGKRKTLHKPAPHRSSRLRSIGKWLFALSLLAFLVLGAYSLYLGQIVRVKFEGKRWMLPARVYARPLELYVGANLSTEQLQAEFKRLGYRNRRRVSGPAQWSQAGGRFVFHSREFRFWDGVQHPQKVRLQIREGVIASLSDAISGKRLDIVRMEPPQIGSIYPAHKEDRVLLKREQLPDLLVAALLAAEDRDYFEHFGVNPASIARAIVADIKAGKLVQGGSTITQQLVKNFYLSSERSLSRKFNEALMAIILDARYSKDEILEAYANEVFLGQDGDRAIHGFGLASWFYFNRPIEELQLPEIALLVGLLKGASYYNPFKHPDRARKRRNLVLSLMVAEGFISRKVAAQAQRLPLGLAHDRRKSNASFPAFMDLVKRQLRRDYQPEDLSSEGLRIFTTLDPWAQSILNRELEKGLAQIETSRHLKKASLQAAMVLVAPQGGEVLALSGDRNPGFAGFNRALDAVRSIGSLIKPVVYLLALSDPDDYTLVTQLEDRAVRIRGVKGSIWKPHNYDRREHGLVPLHRALARSYNLATVHLGMALGVDKVVELLRRMGIRRSLRELPSLLLGAVSLSPLDVAQIYQVLASGGFRAPLRAIREITDADGRPLQRYPLHVVEVAQPGPVYLLNRNLIEVMRSGTGKGIRSYLPKNLEVAGKTGTTDEMRDSWFAGFSADRLGVVWVGRDDNKPMGLTGSSGALKLWGRVMRRLKPMPLGLLPPDDVVYVWVDEKTGFLSAEHCPNAIAMPFISGSEPQLRSECLEAQQSSSNPIESWFE